GNGMAALALQRLSFLTGEARYAASAERAIAQFYPELAAQPGGHTTLLMALEERLVPPRTVILRGPAEPLARWRRALAERYSPATLVLALPADARDLPPVLAKPASDRVNAWVCEGVSCLPPVDRLEDLIPQVSKAVEMHYHRAAHPRRVHEYKHDLVDRRGRPRLRSRARAGRAAAAARQGVPRLPQPRQQGRRPRVQGRREEVPRAQGRRGLSREEDPRGLDRGVGPDPDAPEYHGERGRGAHAREVHPVAEVGGSPWLPSASDRS